MSAGGAAGATTAAQVALISALQSYGTIVRVDPRSFIEILSRSEKPLVVHATSGFFRTVHKYLTPYRGLVFYSKLPAPIQFQGGDVELIEAAKLWVPYM